jgi:transcriptional regulator with XRE-family HTH domain
MSKVIGARIAQARREMAVRERRDVKPVEIARAVGVSGAAVSEWEAGKSVPRDDLMVRLADYLGVTPAFLRYGDPVRGTLTPAQIAEARAKSAAARAHEGGPAPDPAAAPDTPAVDPPARAVAGARRRPKRPPDAK